MEYITLVIHLFNNRPGLNVKTSGYRYYVGSVGRLDDQNCTWNRDPRISNTSKATQDEHLVYFGTR